MKTFNEFINESKNGTLRKLVQNLKNALIKKNKKDANDIFFSLVTYFNQNIKDFDPKTQLMVKEVIKKTPAELKKLK